MKFQVGVYLGEQRPLEIPEFDVLKINAATIDLPQEVEQFTMDFEYNVNLTFAWDKTKVTVPIEFTTAGVIANTESETLPSYF